MDSRQWAAAKALFEAALKCHPDERQMFLRSAADDPIIIAEVQSLLESDAAAAGFLDEPIVGAMSAAIDPAAWRIGPYRVLREIGEGGMGAVWLAVRDDGTYEKTVAIKTIGLPAATQSAIERFRCERQILATLNHPNIAQLLDGGTTDAGLPYVVMEYVEGVPIDRFVTERALTIPERLRLFVRVCAAVEYAHEHGIVHRDLKAPNILVASDGTPKLLDFGIAKLLAPDGASAQVAATTQRMFTPECASPEQIRGEPVTVLSDVYSLGVLLYRLLTGSTPHRSPSQAAHDLERLICEADPPLPSTVCASNRALARQLRGDLDAIVMKALRKEPHRRYTSAKALAGDLRAHLAGQPVAAAGITLRDRARRMLRGYALRVTAVTSVMLLLAGGSSRQMLRLPSQPAERRAVAVLPFTVVGTEDAESLGVGFSDALTAALTELPQITVRPTSSVLKFRDSALDVPALGQRLHADALLTGRVRETGDRLQVTVELLDSRHDALLWTHSIESPATDLQAIRDSIVRGTADALLLKLTAVQQARLTHRHTENPDAYRAYIRGRALTSQRTRDAIRKGSDEFRRAIRIDPTYALPYAGLADAYLIGGEWLAPAAEAASLAKAAAMHALALDDTIAEAHVALGTHEFLNDWNFRIAEQELRRAIQLNPGYAPAYFALGNVLSCEGRLDEAIQAQSQAVAIDPLSPGYSSHHMYALLQAGRVDDAIAAGQQILQQDSHALYVHSMLSLAYVEKGMLKEALAEADTGIAQSGPDDYSALENLGYVAARAGDIRRARAALHQMEILRPTVGESRTALATVQTAMGDSERALSTLEKAYEEHDQHILGIGTDVALRPLRTHPRFIALLRKVGLPRLP